MVICINHICVQSHIDQLSCFADFEKTLKSVFVNFNSWYIHYR